MQKDVYLNCLNDRISRLEAMVEGLSMRLGTAVPAVSFPAVSSPDPDEDTAAAVVYTEGESSGSQERDDRHFCSHPIIQMQVFRAV